VSQELVLMNRDITLYTLQTHGKLSLIIVYVWKLIRQRNNKKHFEIGRITLRLNGTNINRAYYEDPRKEPLLVMFNIHEGMCLPQLAG